MKANYYPIIKNTVRIKKMSSYCWISELLMDYGNKCSAKEAFVLSLCNGKFDVKTIVHIYSEVFGDSEDRAYEYVENTIKRLKVCLDFSSQPVEIIKRYDPEDYVFDLRDELDENGERLETPAEMTLVLTKTCNFKCIYCYNSSGCNNKIEMSMDDWGEVISQAKDLGVVKCTLTGGEPMTHPGFFEILNQLIENDILVYLCTNGSLIDDDAVCKFKELGMPMVQISLDSPNEEKHNLLTQSRDTFNKVTNGIRKLVEAGIKVYVKAVVLPETVDGIEELINLCHELGVSNLVLDQYDLCYAGRGSRRFFLSKEQEEYVKQMVKDKKEELGSDMNISLMISERCWKDENSIVMCGAFLQSFIVVADGDFTVCEKLAGVKEMSVGNFKTMTIKEMWNSPRIKEIMNPVKEMVSEPCKTCEFFQACNTGCFAAKQFVTEDLYAADPRCWRAEYKENTFALK